MIDAAAERANIVSYLRKVAMKGLFRGSTDEETERLAQLLVGIADDIENGEHA